MEYLRKYNTATHVYVPVVKRGVVDHAVGADWTPAAGDVMVSIDGGAFANIGTLPVAVAATRGALWDFVFTGGETTGKKIYVEICDAATKAIEDSAFTIITYGNASAEIVADLSADLGTIIGRIPTALAADGSIKSSLQSILGTAFTEGGAGWMAAGVKKWFNVSAAPVSTMDTPSDSSGITTLLTRLSAARAGVLDALSLGTGTAQAGGASTITLDAGKSATDNLYKRQWIAIVSGTGAGQVNLITGYVGATKVATVRTAWAVQPDNTSVFYLLSAADINSILLADTLTTYTGNTPQTGDAYAKVNDGTFGNSALQTLIAAIKTVTDKFVFTNANKVDATVRAMDANIIDSTALAASAANKIRDAIRTNALSAAYGALTWEQALCIILAACVGPMSGLAGATGHVGKLDGSGDAASATIDVDGNRGVPTLTP